MAKELSQIGGLKGIPETGNEVIAQRKATQTRQLLGQTEFKSLEIDGSCPETTPISERCDAFVVDDVLESWGMELEEVVRVEVVVEEKVLTRGGVVLEGLDETVVDG